MFAPPDATSRTGQGGFATVEACWLTGSDGTRKKVAVKRFRREILQDDTCLRLLCNEIEIMVKHRHK